MLYRKILMIACLIAGTSLANAEEHTVKLLTSGVNGQTMVMEPAYLKINKGDTVNFVPSDASHNAQSVSIPLAAKEFATPMGQEAKVLFNEDGIYLYKCLPHAPFAMVGLIQVGQAVNLDQVKKEALQLNTSVVMNKTRITEYLAQVK